MEATISTELQYSWLTSDEKGDDDIMLTKTQSSK